eukprot:3791438-Pleurochrysis_carterae.AAC.1
MSPWMFHIHGAAQLKADPTPTQDHARATIFAAAAVAFPLVHVAGAMRGCGYQHGRHTRRATSLIGHAGGTYSAEGATMLYHQGAPVAVRLSVYGPCGPVNASAHLLLVVRGERGGRCLFSWTALTYSHALRDPLVFRKAFFSDLRQFR